MKIISHLVEGGQLGEAAGQVSNLAHVDSQVCHGVVGEIKVRQDVADLPHRVFNCLTCSGGEEGQVW